MGDGRQNGLGCCLSFLEAPVKALHDLHHSVAHQDDRTGFDDICPTAAEHGDKGTLEGGDLVFGQFDDKERLAAAAGDFIDQDRAHQDDQDTGKVHKGADPGCAFEESAGKQRDDRQLCAAGHKGRQHSGSTTLPLITDGTASHNTGDGATGTDDKGDHGLTGKTHLLENGVQNHGRSCHITAVLQQGNEEIHHHNQGQESNNRHHTADHTINQQRLQNGCSAGYQLRYPALESFQPGNQGIGQPHTQTQLAVRLRKMEHQEHNQRKDGNAHHGMRQNCIDAILEVFIFGANCTGLYLGNDLINKSKALAISGTNRILIAHIHITLGIGRALGLACLGKGSLDHFCQALVAGNGRRGLHHRAAQLHGQGQGVDLGLLLGVNIRLVQCDHHRDAQFQQLCGEKQAAAQICRVHNVNDHIGIFLLHVGAGDAFF